MNITVTLERNGKVIHIVLRQDDFNASVHNGKMKYGSGKVWNVKAVR